MPNGSINCSARTNWLLLSNPASSLPTNMWTVKVLCFIRVTYTMPKPLCSCILADMMLRCFYSEGLCLYRFVCLAFRCIICEGPILTSVPKQFGSFSYSLHILLSQLSPVLFPESPTWLSQGRSCLWNLRDAPFCFAVNVRIITACCFFWGFTWLFRHRNTAVSCCLQKRSILISQKRSADSVWDWGLTESLAELLKVWVINERAVCEDHSRADHYVETHLWCWQCVVTAAVKGTEVYIAG